MAPAKKKQKLSNGTSAVTESLDDAETSQPQSINRDDKAEQQRRSLFVRSLPASTTSQTLTDLFSELYPVKHATAVIDPATKQCRGYGFVTFADAEDAQRAKEEFNGHSLEGKKLRIEVAEPRRRETEKADDTEPGAAKRTKNAPDLPQPSRLIVRNLPWTIKTSDQLSKLFLSYGKIKQAYIPEKRPGLMAGFGFVVLRGRKNAEKAMDGINGKEVDGRTLAVDWAVSKDVYEDLLKKGEEEEQDLEDESRPSRPAGREHVDGEDPEGDDVDGAPDEDNVVADEESEDDEQNFEDEDEDVDIRVDGDSEDNLNKSDDRSTTLFVRNVPFTCTDEDLEDHFSRFGSTRYARVVVDSGTERSKGTGFVCFYNKADADACLRGAPKRTMPVAADNDKEAKTSQVSNSILQNEATDPSGQYTIDGRVLQLSRAVDKSEATRLTEESASHRRKRNEDKRRLYLLSEGTISSNSKLWDQLSPSERTIREASAKQRKTLIESNPSLHLSLTRLSIRNIPRSIGSKELKALAREAVVGFATDAKAGTRQKLSKEELSRGGEEMQAAEQARKKAGKGVVKQAKVVFEGAGGSKVSEDSSAGRSRGYGFIEYYTHRSALMGLRWLNGHAVGYQVKEREGKGQKGKIERKEELQERKKRLIVEFAIENAQVVLRRNDREKKARERGEGAATADAGDRETRVLESHKRKRVSEIGPKSGSQKKRVAGPVTKFGSRREKGAGTLPNPKSHGSEKPKHEPKKPIDEKLARRNQIIGRKRAMRRTRKGSK